MVKVFKCMHCGNVTLSLVDSGVPMICCGEPMVILNANTTDAATEKHVPVLTIDGNMVSVVVGSVEHPMMEKHHIAFIILETDRGLQVKYLDHEGSPKATFALEDGEKVIAAYEYCNLHGFWKVEA